VSPEVAALRRAVEARPGDVGARVDLLLAVADSPEAEAVLEDTARALARTWSLGQPEFDAAVMKACERLVVGLPDGFKQSAVRLLAGSLWLQRVSTTPEAVDCVRAWLEPFGHATMSASVTQRVGAAEALAVAGFAEAARAALALCDATAPAVVALESLLDVAADQVDAALARLGPALSASPDDVTLLAAGASALLRAGRPDDAVAMLEHALAQGGDRVDLWANLVSAHVLAGRPALALGLVDGLVERLGAVPMLVGLQKDIAASIA
jgi:hypothetical protein